MPDPIPLEGATIRAVASPEIETPTARRPLDSEQNMANRMREVSAEKSARETMVDSLNQSPKYEEMIALADENIGTDLNEFGEKVREDDVEDRYDEVIEMFDGIYSYIGEGFDGMDPVARTEAMGQIEADFRLLPGAPEFLNGLSVTEKDKIMENIMRNPNYRNFVLSGLTEIKNNSILKDAEVNKAKETVKETESAKAQKERELTGIDKELKEAEDQADLFNVGGEKAVKLEELDNELPILEGEIKNVKVELSDVNSELAEIDRKYNNIIAVAKGKGAVGEVTEAENDRKNERDPLVVRKKAAEAKIAEFEEKKIMKAKLEEQRKEFRKNRKEAQGEKDRIETELDPLRQKHSLAEAKLARAIRARVTEEGEFVTKVNNIYSDAAIEFLKKEVAETEAAQIELLEKDKTEAKDDLKKRMLSQIGQEMWTNPTTKRGILRPDRQTVEIDKTFVDARFVQMLREGPEASMRAALLAKGFNAAEIEEKMKDAEFMGKAQTMFVEQLITKKIKTGKITENEANIIGATPWGTEAIAAAIAKNSSALANSSELRSIGGLTGDGIREWIRNNPNKSFASVLLAVLFGLPLAMVGLGISGGLATAGAVAGAGAVGTGGLAGIRSVQH